MRRAGTRRTILLGGLLCALLAPGAAGAQGWVLDLDPGSTRIAFTLAATFHDVHGSARLTAGEVRFDPETGGAAGRIVIDARSLATGNARRDRKMHRAVLESERFPEIVFLPERLQGSFDPDGRSGLQLSGTLEIHGGRHPLTLPAQVRAQGGALAATASFVLPYVEWGMEDVSTLFLRVGKTLAVDVETVGVLRSQ